MKRIMIFRHAKSDWGDPGVKDYDRPLSARGERDAYRMGQFFHEERLRWDAALVSSALRSMQTYDLMDRGFEQMTVDPQISGALYLASVERILQLIHGQDERAGSLLLIGHNPGFHELALMLLANNEESVPYADKFPTAALAMIDCDVDHWADIGPGCGQLALYQRPKALA
ncbi:MAG: histidine phosphatase family protein [Sphingomonadales bacterium]